ncbi:hypothetical protein AB0L70_35870 [Kribbella sp. NPDC051952]|uniref:hypothetical protein n=1 Tax=Kribbella sp. NPDC051952 TaxID=3154851 RepID=UPI003419E659
MTTISAGTGGAGPVLVGDSGRPGLTIVPSSTPLTRLNYFDGKFLRAADFQLDQGYLRMLVALTARGSGSGVVTGFEAELAGGDGLLLRGGLAVSAAGSVIDLPGDVTVSITELLARTDGVAVAPGSTGGNSDFGPCAAVTPAGPDAVLTDQPVYLLTVATEDALCGEEERFDQLCTDACLTETDRPRRVEGVRLQAHRLDLGTLPSSTSVTFTATHLRSQVAGAYFALEQALVADRRSAAGLRSSVWCAGAAGSTGDEVPIGVLGRNGTATTFLDLWTARRELMEGPAQRYWAGRFGMRPWDMFIAQVLQFQCQLAGSGSAAAAQPVSFGRAAAAVRGVSERLGGILADPDRLIATRRALGPELVEQLLSLRLEAGELLRLAPRAAAGGAGGAGSGSLVAGGIVTLPPFGFLAIDVARPVTEQLPGVFGAGVDLRYAAAPADQVAEIMRQAQDLNRISLTAGLDDPADRAPVDVIVPDGTLSGGTAVTLPTYAGSVRILPQERSDGSTSGSVTVITGVARDLSSKNVAWAAAGHTEIPQRVPFARAVSALLRGRTPADPAGGPVAGGEPGDGPVEVPVTTDASLDAAAARPSLAFRLNRERLLARARRTQVDLATGGASKLTGELAPDRPIAATDARTMDLWLDFTINAPLADAQTGDQARVQGMLAAYSRASRTPSAIEFTLDGQLTVIDRVDQAGQFGAASTTVISSRFTGTLTLREFADTTQTSSDGIAGRVDWTFVRTGSQTRLVGVSKLVVEEQKSRASLVLGAEVTRSALGLTGSLGSSDAAGSGVQPNIRIVGNWIGAGSKATAIPGVDQTLATFELTRDDEALTIGRTERDLAEAVIESIGAGLAGIDRDPGFVARAQGLLLPALPDAPQTITATRDWVAFTRRRDVRYVSDAPPPVVTRSYLVYHVVVDDLEDLDRFENPSAGQGFERVGVVQFSPGSGLLVTPIDAVRAAFAVQDRGTALVLQLAADAGNGDGDTVLASRLAAYRGAVAGLIDTTQVQPPKLLAGVPPDFVSSGIDGVLFTVGYRAPVATGTQALFAVTPAQREQLEGLAVRLGGWKAVTLEKLRSITDDLNNQVTARFVGETPTNPDEIDTWWAANSGAPPAEVVLHVTAAVATAGEDALEKDRANQPNGAASPVTVDEPIADAGDNRAVVLWVRADDQVLIEVTSQLLVALTKGEAAQLDLAAKTQGGYPALDDAAVRELVQDSPVLEVSYSGGDIAEPEKVREWWGQITADPPRGAFVHPAADAPKIADEVRRASRVTSLLGGRRAVAREPVGGAAGHRAVVYLIR